MIVDEYINLIRSGKTPDDVQVLCAIRRKTECGSDALNVLLQNAINPPSPSKGEVQFGSRIYRVGDKIMQSKNDYQKECYNGDCGYIIAVHKNGQDPIVIVKFDENREIEFVGREEILELELAYACSVHKSQGSEYETIIMPVVASHEGMLKKNLFYTGVTRAKKNVRLIGTRQAIHHAVNNKNVDIRNSKLKERLMAA